MIEKIVKLRGVGLLHDAVPSGALVLKPVTMIYAENGRGKSTFARICHSMSTGDATSIQAQSTIRGSYRPEVQFRVNNQNYVFRDGQWSSPCPDILVFDEYFVEQNVCIGSRVEPSHRENLLEFAIGEQGVRLKEEVDDISARIDDINKELRRLGDLISQHKGPFTLDHFIQLRPSQELDTKLQEIQRKLRDAENVEAIRRRPVPEPLVMPEFDLSCIEHLLGNSLETVAAEAERRVKDHIERHLDAAGEQWLRQGVGYLDDAIGCPFCGQNVSGLDLVEAYRQYFDDAYDDLKGRVECVLEELKERWGGQKWSVIDARLQLNKSSENSWADTPSLKFPTIEHSALASAFAGLLDTAVTVLNQKLSDPLSQLPVPEALHQANSHYLAMRSRVDEYNQVVHNVRAAIDMLKRSLETANRQHLRDEISRLEAQRRRMQPDVVELCDKYVRLQQEKSGLEELKAKKREELDAYTSTQLQRYKEEINNVLRRFHAGFAIGEITVAYAKGIPRTEYGLQVMDEMISASSQSGHSFGNTLSGGDKKTLALAFFLARLRLDPHPGQRIAILDDPVSSLDTGRRRATRDVLVEIANQCSQLIVLSHDATFLKDLLERVDQDNCVTLRIRRSGDFSVADYCDIYRICREDYYQTYEEILRYLEDGPEDNESRIAEDIRKYLEHNLRNRFPIELEQARNLGEMIRRIREQAESFGQLAERLKDLETLNDFTSPYHHMASDRPLPPTDAELRPMVRLALAIGKG